MFDREGSTSGGREKGEREEENRERRIHSERGRKKQIMRWREIVVGNECFLVCESLAVFSAVAGHYPRR